MIQNTHTHTEAFIQKESEIKAPETKGMLNKLLCIMIHSFWDLTLFSFLVL